MKIKQITLSMKKVVHFLYDIQKSKSYMIFLDYIYICDWKIWME